MKSGNDRLAEFPGDCGSYKSQIERKLNVHDVGFPERFPDFLPFGPCKNKVHTPHDPFCKRWVECFEHNLIRISTACADNGNPVAVFAQQSGKSLRRDHRAVSDVAKGIQHHCDVQKTGCC